jgi:Na+-driven multidrug efflux pump
MWNDNDGQWHMMGGNGSAWAMILVFLLIVIAGAAVLVLVLRSPRQPEVDPAARTRREKLPR